MGLLTNPRAEVLRDGYWSGVGRYLIHGNPSFQGQGTQWPMALLAGGPLAKFLPAIGRAGVRALPLVGGGLALAGGIASGLGSAAGGAAAGAGSVASSLIRNLGSPTPISVMGPGFEHGPLYLRNALIPVNASPRHALAAIDALERQGTNIQTLLDLGAEGEWPEAEFFSLGGLLKSVAKVAAPIVSALVPGVGPLIGAGLGALGGSGSSGGVATVASPAGAAASIVGTAPLTSEETQACQMLKDVGWSLGSNKALYLLTIRHPSVMMDLITSLEKLTRLRELPELLRDYDSRPEPDYHCDFCAEPQGFLPEGKGLKAGKFFSSPMMTAMITKDLGNGIHGEIRLDKVPFPIRISANQNGVRANLALMHELVHLANRLYKLNLRHDQVHQLAVFNLTEGKAALQALDQWLTSR